MTVLCTTDLRSSVAQQRLFIPCIRREEVETVMEECGALRYREWGCSEDGGFFEGSSCLISANSSIPERWFASFCIRSSAPICSFVFVMFSLGSRLKAIRWILTLVSVLGTVVMTSALASVGVSDEVLAVALFSFSRHLGLFSRTGKMTKGDFAGGSES